MTIKSKCGCGKAFAVADQYAGKKVKCPACGNPVTIPDVAATPSAATPATLPVSCSCGKSLAVKVEYAGKRIKCPACGNPVTVPSRKPLAQSAGKSRTSGNEGNSESGSLDDLLDEVDLSATKTGQRCPECRADMGPEDILCIKCGYRIDRGRRIETKKVKKPVGVSLTAGVPDHLRKKDVPPDAKQLVKILRILGYINLIIVLIGVVAIVAMITLSQLPAELAGFFAGLIVVSLAINGVGIWALFWAARKVEEGKNSGRIAAIIMAILSLPSVPIGTIIGILLLLKAFSPEVVEHCRG